MSDDDQMQLSREIIHQIRDLLSARDPQAADPWVSSQYLAAILGYTLATEELPVPREELLARLFAFAQQVMNDLAPEAAAAPTPAASNGAFGVWRPGD